jgi:hypothetical protein
MRLVLAAAAILAVPATVASQAAGRFPPDSLINVQVFPRTTPVAEVTAAMRSFAMGLGVRCQFCHAGEEGMPLERFDFASDEKRTKLVARQMMRMVQEINRRLDTIPGSHGDGARGELRDLSSRRQQADATLDAHRRRHTLRGSRLRSSGVSCASPAIPRT